MDEITIYDRNDLYGEKGKYNKSNLFIEAGAGAGKTETLIYLIVSQLYSGVSPERIVGITFTNKATEELVNRISEIIEEKINSKDTADDKKIILSNALKNLYKMNISTIHHFCNVILNENSYKAKVSYNAVLLEEDDEIKRRDDFYFVWFHSLSDEQIKEIAFSADDAFKKLKNTYDALCEQFDDVKVNSEFSFDIDKLISLIINVYDLLSEYPQENWSSNASEFIEEFGDLHTNKDNLNNAQLFKTYITKESLKFINKKIKLKNGGDVYSKAEIVAANNDDIDPIMGELIDLKTCCEKEYIPNECFKLLNKYAIEAWEYFKTSRDRTYLSNNQLIYETYQLFKNNPDIKEKLAKQFDLILVDEFQDTDHYQNMFIMDLALAIDKRKEKEGIVSSSIILVGDPKQSIYGFRGADFELFMETKNNFSSCGLRNAINISLPDNYRSNQFVLGWINDTYKKKEFFPSYKYKDMIGPKENTIPTEKVDGVLAGVYSYDLSGENKFYKTARFVKLLKENNYKIYSRAHRNDQLSPRNIKYSDILILTTSHSEITKYVLAFNKENIKTLVSGEFDLGGSTSFNYLYKILKYLLDDSSNNKKLFSESFNGEIYSENKLEELKENTKYLSAYGKMIYVFNNIDIILENFEETDKELLKTIIAQISESVSYNASYSSLELLDKIERLMREFAESELSLRPDEDAVRIMNVHKSKGLTAEVVLFVDSGGFPPEGNCVVFEKKIFLNNFKLHKKLISQQQKSKSAEKLRLEYVAATRARQVMIFSSSFKTAGQLFNRDDEPYDFASLDLYHVESELPAIDVEEIENTKVSKKVSNSGFESIEKSLTKTLLKEASPSSLEKKVNIEEKKKYNRPSNDVFGTIFHRIMELYVANKNKDISELINRAIKENVSDVPNDEKDVYIKYLNDCVCAAIKLFKDNNILENYKVIEPEMKFCDYSDSLYGNVPTLMSGSIDLFLKNNDDILILDYKTDTNYFDNNSHFEDVLKEKYSNQLNTYKKVISKIEKISESKVNAKIIWLEEKEDGCIAHFVNI